MSERKVLNVSRIFVFWLLQYSIYRGIALLCYLYLAWQAHYIDVDVDVVK